MGVIAREVVWLRSEGGWAGHGPRACHNPAHGAIPPPSARIPMPASLGARPPAWDTFTCRHGAQPSPKAGLGAAAWLKAPCWGWCRMRPDPKTPLPAWRRGLSDGDRVSPLLPDSSFPCCLHREKRALQVSVTNPVQCSLHGRKCTVSVETKINQSQPDFTRHRSGFVLCVPGN